MSALRGLLLCAALAGTLGPPTVLAAGDEAAIMARIASIRAMPAVAVVDSAPPGMPQSTEAAATAAAIAQRHELDAAWRFFGDQRDESLPLLRRELSAELRAARPSHQLLLDAGYFLRRYGNGADTPLAMQALLAIPPTAPVDGAQLFRFAHAMAGERDPRMFPLLDGVFLRKKIRVPLPQQGTVIDENGSAALLYGRFGPEGERRLAAQLADNAAVERALEVLMLTGSPDSVAAVAPLLRHEKVEVFTLAVNFLLRSGGPEGRAALLALKPQGLTDEAKQFFAPLREQIARQPAPPAGQGTLPDAEVRRQLDVLEASSGRYEGVDPAVILQSRLPKQELLERLRRIRERSFGRATTEALADIETTSALLNAVHYRDN